MAVLEEDRWVVVVATGKDREPVAGLVLEIGRVFAPPGTGLARHRSGRALSVLAIRCLTVGGRIRMYGGRGQQQRQGDCPRK